MKKITMAVVTEKELRTWAELNQRKMLANPKIAELIIHEKYPIHYRATMSLEDVLNLETVGFFDEYFDGIFSNFTDLMGVGVLAENGKYHHWISWEETSCDGLVESAFRDRFNLLPDVQ